MSKSGLPVEWASLAVRHELMHRRCQPTNEEGDSIYTARHPGCKLPMLCPFGAKIVFKPPPLQGNGSKMATPGRDGIIVGYDVQPGGAWSGDYKVVELMDFESGNNRRNARVDDKNCTIQQ